MTLACGSDFVGAGRIIEAGGGRENEAGGDTGKRWESHLFCQLSPNQSKADELTSSVFPVAREPKSSLIPSTTYGSHELQIGNRLDFLPFHLHHPQ